MTATEYFEGLGCSPDEAQTCAKASRERYQGEIMKAIDSIEDGCILMTDEEEW